MRRQFGLRQQAGALPLDDLRWLNEQGFRSLAEVPRMAMWYRPDGSSHIGHADAYHLHLYRLRGMTLKAPVSAAQEPQPRRVPVPSIARKVLSLLGQGERWEGSASDLAAIMGSRTPTGISRALGTPKMAVALAAAGVTVERGYRGNGRVLRLECRSAASVTSAYIRRQSDTLKKKATGTKSQMLSAN
jgi:hypothetical protein